MEFLAEILEGVNPDLFLVVEILPDIFLFFFLHLVLPASDPLRIL